MKNCPFRHIAKLSDVSNLETLLDLLKFRETFLFNKLMADIKRLTPLVGAYNVLMQETSDVMQNLAQTYGERHALEYCIEQLSVLKNAKNQEVMALCFQLFGADAINRDLGFYMLHGVVNTEAAKALTPKRHEIIKKVASNALDILDCLNIPKHALYAPIAGDYVKYNSSPNYGEIVGSKL